MSGGKGGSTTSSVEIPEYIEEAARRNLAKAEDISQIGYVPYYGPDVAAFTPFQEAGFQQTADVASAFGMGPQMSQTDIMGGMPAATEFAGGVRGYSSAPLYQEAVDELAAQRPAQAQFIESFFIDPVTGQVGSRVPTDYDYISPVAPVAPVDGGGGGVAPIVAPVAPVAPVSPVAPYAPADPALAIQPDPEIFDATPPDVQVAQEVLATDPLSPQYNEAFETDYDYQAQQAAQDPTGQSTGFGITPEIIDAVGVDAFLPPQVPDDYILDPAISAAIEEIGYTPIGSTNTQASTLITDPAASITDTSTASAFTQQMNDIQEALIGMLPLDESYSVGGVNNPIETPTLGEMQGASPPSMRYDAPTGSYVALDGAMPTGAIRPPSRPTGDEVSGGGLLSNIGDIGEFIASGGVTGAALRGVGGLLEPAFDAVESGIASMIGDPRTPAQRNADRLEAERLRAIDRSQEESAAVEAQREAARTAQEKLKVADPDAFVAQFGKEGKADAKKAVKTAQKLAVAPRPPSLTSGKARDWLKSNLGVSVDKRDATDYIRSAQQDWDRQNA